MDQARLGRPWWSAPAVLLMGCATTGAGSFDSMRTEVDRAAIVDDRAKADDERALGAPALERAAYVRAVLHRNPSIEAARQGWRAAIARVRQSGSFEDPMVTLEVAPLSIASSTARLGYSATVSQRVPWPGKLSLEESVAKAEAEAARSDFEATRRELALTAALLYDQYFIASRSLEVNAQHVVLMRELKAAALAQLESGRATAQDPLQAEAELTHMEHDAVILASQHDVTVAQMNELLHRDPDVPLPPPTNELALPSAPDIREAKKLEDEAAGRRPEIQAALLHARAEQARAERAERESYPDVTLSTTYNSMWDTPEHRWMVGLGLNLPVVLARRAGAADEANASRARFEAEAAQIVDQTRADVVVAMKRLEEANHVLHLFEQRLIPVARDLVDAARAGFIASRTDFATVIAAEKNLRSAELEYQVARANFDRRRAELDHTLGRMPGLDEPGVAR
jgi:cobalt-zinc-cadmium efflux system outer membrane protein